MATKSTNHHSGITASVPTPIPTPVPVPVPAQLSSNQPWGGSVKKVTELNTEVGGQLKASPESRRSILGTPLSHHVKDAVVNGQMSDKSRSKLINDINTSRHEATVAVLDAAPDIITLNGTSRSNPMGNANSAEVGAILRSVALEMSNAAQGSDNNPPPPKRVLTAKRSNRPERPVPSTFKTSVSSLNQLHLSANAKPILKPDTTQAPKTMNSPGPARVISDIAPLSSAKDTPVVGGISRGEVLKVTNIIPGMAIFKTQTGNLKRKRESLRVSTGENRIHLEASPRNPDDSLSTPSQKQKGLLSSIAGMSSKTTPAKPSRRSDIRDPEKRSPINERVVNAKSTQIDSPIDPVAAENASTDDSSMDDFESIHDTADDGSAEDSSMADDDSESGKDRTTASGRQINPNEEILMKVKDMPGGGDTGKHDYTLCKCE